MQQEIAETFRSQDSINIEHVKKGSALKLFKETPVDVREASALDCFKKQLKAYL